MDYNNIPWNSSPILSCSGGTGKRNLTAAANVHVSRHIPRRRRWWQSASIKHTSRRRAVVQKARPGIIAICYHQPRTSHHRMIRNDEATVQREVHGPRVCIVKGAKHVRNYRQAIKYCTKWVSQREEWTSECIREESYITAHFSVENETPNPVSELIITVLTTSSTSGSPSAQQHEKLSCKLEETSALMINSQCECDKLTVLSWSNMLLFNRSLVIPY